MSKTRLMLKKIQECFREDRIYYSRHARDEMEGEESGEIKDEEVFETVSAGKIIENYPEDEPYPSCLIMVEQQKIGHCMQFVHIRKMKSYPLL